MRGWRGLVGVEVAEMEEAARERVSDRSTVSKKGLLQVVSIDFLVHGSVDVLMRKVFEDEWKVVGVQEQLSQILVLEDVCSQSEPAHNPKPTSTKLTGQLEPFQKHQ